MEGLVSAAIARTKELLFPIRVGRWLKIWIVLLLAGGTSPSFRGSSNLKPSAKPARPAAAAPAASPVQPAPTAPAAGPETSPAAAPMPAPAVQPAAAPPAEASAAPQPAAPAPAPSASDPNPAAVDQTKARARAALASLRALGAPAWAAIALALVAMLALLSWINCRFRFVLLDFLVHDTLSVRESFARNAPLGNSLFGFQLPYSVLSLGALAAIAYHAATSPGPLWTRVLMLLPAILAFLLAGLLVSLLLTDFLVPLMYHRSLGIAETARLFFSKSVAWGDVILYYLMKVGLLIGAAILQALCVMAALIPVVIAGIAAGALHLLDSMSLALKIALGAPLALAFALLVVLVSVPFAVFFQCFRLCFLSRLLPEFQFFGTQEPAAPKA
ncbi:MAG TPA: hypothetical protein VNI01_06020 [Elusimicrobiota bacterium]|nr:hypothetical protein [Elusimicrobiota bacterium]